MKKKLLVNRKLKGNATAQAYTFASRTSRHTDQKLQKSMFLPKHRKRPKMIKKIEEINKLGIFENYKWKCSKEFNRNN